MGKGWGEGCLSLLVYYLRLPVMAAATSTSRMAVERGHGAGTRLSITTIKCKHWTLVLARLAPFQVGYKCANYVKPESVLGGAENRRVKPKWCKPCSSFFDHAETDPLCPLGPSCEKGGGIGSPMKLLLLPLDTESGGQGQWEEVPRPLAGL